MNFYKTIFNLYELSTIALALHFTHGSSGKLSFTLEEIFNKIRHNIKEMYDNLYDILVDYSGVDKFSVSLVRESAIGLDTFESNLNIKVPAHLRGDGLGDSHVTTTFTFDKSDSIQFKRSIATIIYYITKYRAVAIIRENNNYGKLALGLSMNGVLRPEYLMTSWSKNPFSLILGPSLQTYKTYIDRFEGLWSNEDIYAICAYSGSNNEGANHLSYEYMFLNYFSKLDGQRYSNVDLLSIR